MNLNVKAEGQNEHHKIEGIFKALARALKWQSREISIILNFLPAKGYSDFLNTQTYAETNPVKPTLGSNLFYFSF